MLNWRVFISAVAGRIVGSFFVGICIALGFGPTQWAAFLISGLPLFITPGVARLVLLLLASLTLLSLLWNWIATSQYLPVKLTFIAAICLPFVAGSFYVTAIPTPQRHLKLTQKERLVANFKKIKDDVDEVYVGISSGDESDNYAGDWIDIIDEAGIRGIGIPASPGENECGIMVGALDVANPSNKAKKVINALRKSGFRPQVIPLSWHPRVQHPAFDFDLFIGPACKG